MWYNIVMKEKLSDICRKIRCLHPDNELECAIGGKRILVKKNTHFEETFYMWKFLGSEQWRNCSIPSDVVLDVLDAIG